MQKNMHGKIFLRFRTVYEQTEPLQDHSGRYLSVRMSAKSTGQKKVKVGW